MAAGLKQQGSAGAMRDLDYVNPRPPKASSALPPDVRARLLGRRGGRSSSEPPPDELKAYYVGAANAEPKVGKSGAGTDWHNPNGHAFIRKGSGVPMSKRASGHARATGQSSELIALQSRVSTDGITPSSRSSSRASSHDSRPGSTNGRKYSKDVVAAKSHRPPHPPLRGS